MAKKTANIKKKTGPHKVAKTTSKRENTKSNVTPKQESNVLLEVKGATTGEKGAELHLSMEREGGSKENHSKNKISDGQNDFHLCVGSKGGDKHEAKG